MTSDDPESSGPDRPADDRVVAEVAAPPRRSGPIGAIRQTLYKQPGGNEQTPATEVAHAEIGEVNASTVLMDRSGAERITSERVSMDRSGSRTIDAKSVQMDRSGVVAMGSEHTVLLNSAAVQVVAEEARVSKSKVFWISTERATIEDSRIVVFSGTAVGQVQTIFTTKTAAIFGGAAGLALVAFGLLAKTARGRA